MPSLCWGGGTRCAGVDDGKNAHDEWVARELTQGAGASLNKARVACCSLLMGGEVPWLCQLPWQSLPWWCCKPSVKEEGASPRLHLFLLLKEQSP